MEAMKEEPVGENAGSQRPRRNSAPHIDGVRLRDIERAAIERTLAQTGNNQTKAARILAISRQTLVRKLREYRAYDAARARKPPETPAD